MSLESERRNRYKQTLFMYPRRAGKLTMQGRAQQFNTLISSDPDDAAILRAHGWGVWENIRPDTPCPNGCPYEYGEIIATKMSVCPAVTHDVTKEVKAYEKALWEEFNGIY